MGNRGLVVVVAGAKSGVSASARYAPPAMPVPLAINAISVATVESTTLSWQRAKANSVLLPLLLYPAAAIFSPDCNAITYARSPLEPKSV